MQSAGEERGRVCPSPSFYSEVRQCGTVPMRMWMRVVVVVIMRVMYRTREVEEAAKGESDNLGQLDQTPHASSTLGECETLLA